MSKGPTPRHSKSPKPLTIDLDATDVTPRSAPDADTKPTPDKPAADQAAAKAVETGAGGRPAEKAPEKTPVSGSGGTAKAATGEAMPSESKTEAPAGKKTDASSDKPAAAGADIKTDSKTGESASSGRAGGSASAMPGAESKTAGSQSKPSEPKPVQPAPSKRGGGFGMVVSGLIGAIIALGGGYGLQTAGLLPVPGASPESGEIQSLASRVDGLAGTVDQLSGNLSALSAGGETDMATELQARLASLEAAIAGGAGNSGDSGSVDLGPLTGRLDALEASIAALGESAGDASADPELAAAVAELKAGQSGVNAAISEIQSRSSALSDSIAGLEQRQATLEARLDEPSRQIDLARAIAAAGLKTAIDRGGPFMSELEAFASVAPDDPAVPEFRDLAARGVPSRSGLMEPFRRRPTGRSPRPTRSIPMQAGGPSDVERAVGGQGAAGRRGRGRHPGRHRRAHRGPPARRQSRCGAERVEHSARSLAGGRGGLRRRAGRTGARGKADRVVADWRGAGGRRIRSTGQLGDR
jgi:hypothetical protein